MTEFDFDELDKAVNDLMSGVDTTKRNPALDDPEDTVVALNNAKKAQNESTPIEPTPTEPTTPSKTNQPTRPSLAVKRRGQFMDMVHPSSDMKTPQKINRQAASVEPAHPDVTPDPVDAAPSLDAPAALTFDMESTASVAEASTSRVSEKSDDTASQASDFPDPIDFAAEQQHAESQPPVTPDADTSPDAVLASERPEEPESSDMPLQSERTPLTTPFLTDAKVEKRPLGEPAPLPLIESDTSSSEPVASTSDSETSVEGSGVISSDASQSLPEEFSSDVMALESAPPVSTPTESSQPEAPSLPTPAAEAESAPKPNTSSVAVPGNGSIMQQYTESTSTGDQTNGAIYDTQTYHQPVNTPQSTKKSSPVKWALWVLALLIVGALAGAAYFYFTR